VRHGIVCPYSFDMPGGVQYHVRDLAEVFLAQGHDVSVLAPANDRTPLPPYVVSAGRAIPVKYNGSTARLNIGPMAAARVTRWVGDGRIGVLQHRMDQRADRIVDHGVRGHREDEAVAGEDRRLVDLARLVELLRQRRVG